MYRLGPFLRFYVREVLSALLAGRSPDFIAAKSLGCPGFLNMRLLLSLTLVALAVVGCGNPAAQCLNDLPASCPNPIPSYASSVSGIINQTCVIGCHSATGTAPDRPLNTYADVYEQRSPVLTQAYSCQMPPDGSPPLTPTQRTQLFGWLVCGAPNN